MESESPSAGPVDQQLTAEDLIAPTDEERTVWAGWRSIGPGLLLIVLGVMALYAASDLPGRRGFALGPGTMPSLLSAVLLVLGIAAVMEEFFRGRILMPASIMPVAIVCAAGAIFIVAVNYVGLAVATCLTTAIVAGYYLRTRYVALAAVVVTSIVAFALLEAVRRLSS
jgi:Tripartite tricarboxylate transporter TctB family